MIDGGLNSSAPNSILHSTSRSRRNPQDNGGGAVVGHGLGKKEGGSLVPEETRGAAEDGGGANIDVDGGGNGSGLVEKGEGEGEEEEEEEGGRKVHLFRVKSFPSLLWCEVCQKLLFGVSRASRGRSCCMCGFFCACACMVVGVMSTGASRWGD